MSKAKAGAFSSLSGFVSLGGNLGSSSEELLCAFFAFLLLLEEACDGLELFWCFLFFSSRSFFLFFSSLAFRSRRLALAPELLSSASVELLPVSDSSEALASGVLLLAHLLALLTVQFGKALHQFVAIGSVLAPSLQFVWGPRPTKLFGPATRLRDESTLFQHVDAGQEEPTALHNQFHHLVLEGLVRFLEKFDIGLDRVGGLGLGHLAGTAHIQRVQRMEEGFAALVTGDRRMERRPWTCRPASSPQCNRGAGRQRQMPGRNRAVTAFPSRLLGSSTSDGPSLSPI